jgi:hypothetical protein
LAADDNLWTLEGFAVKGGLVKGLGLWNLAADERR